MIVFGFLQCDFRFLIGAYKTVRSGHTLVISQMDVNAALPFRQSAVLLYFLEGLFHKGQECIFTTLFPYKGKLVDVGSGILQKLLFFGFHKFADCNDDFVRHFLAIDGIDQRIAVDAEQHNHPGVVLQLFVVGKQLVFVGQTGQRIVKGKLIDRFQLVLCFAQTHAEILFNHVDDDDQGQQADDKDDQQVDPAGR